MYCVYRELYTYILKARQSVISLVAMETHWDHTSLLHWPSLASYNYPHLYDQQQHQYRAKSPGRPKCLASIDNLNNYDDANNDVFAEDDGQVEQGARPTLPTEVIDLLQMLPVKPVSSTTDEDNYTCNSDVGGGESLSTVHYLTQGESGAGGETSHALSTLRISTMPSHKDQQRSATLYPARSTNSRSNAGTRTETTGSIPHHCDVTPCLITVEGDTPFLCSQCQDSSVYRAQNRCNTNSACKTMNYAYSSKSSASDYRSMKLYDRVVGEKRAGPRRGRSVERFNCVTYSPSLPGGGTPSGGGSTPAARTPGEYAQLNSLKSQANSCALSYDNSESYKHQQQQTLRYCIFPFQILS